MYPVSRGADVNQQHGTIGRWRQNRQVNSACRATQALDESSNIDQLSGGLLARNSGLWPLRDELRTRDARAMLSKVFRPSRQV